MTIDTFTAALDTARELGTDAGRAAGSWVIDGNTDTATLREILHQIDECEFDVPAPLSGEWSGDPLPCDILAQVGMDETDDTADDVLSEYEQAFTDAYLAEVQRSAQASLPDNEDY